jgi:hypothetical protein
MKGVERELTPDPLETLPLGRMEKRQIEAKKI